MDRTTMKSETSSNSEEIAKVASELTKRLRMPANEGRRAKFVRLVNKRTASAIKAIRYISRLGAGKNAYNYEFCQDDIAAIAWALKAEIETLERIMVPTGIQLDVEFDVTKGPTV